jgi:3-hydroxybutyryl-CoA dehydrogenase
VDGIMRANMGIADGPFQLMDNVGLDVVLDIEEHYAQEFPHLPTGPRALLHSYVDAGKLGRKSGEGFYKYE